MLACVFNSNKVTEQEVHGMPPWHLAGCSSCSSSSRRRRRGPRRLRLEWWVPQRVTFSSLVTPHVSATRSTSQCPRVQMRYFAWVRPCVTDRLRLRFQPNRAWMRCVSKVVPFRLCSLAHWQAFPRLVVDALDALDCWAGRRREYWASTL